MRVLGEDNYKRMQDSRMGIWSRGIDWSNVFIKIFQTMITRKNAKMILLGLIILLIIGTQEPAQKRAVADIEGIACVVDTDCPCWGKVEGAGVETFGFGTSSCEENKCSTTFCVDVQPVGQWFIAHPWTYLKTHPMVILSSIGLIVLLAYWPKI